LEADASRTRLAERVQLLLVDEFQDTSPMQLAIFLKLAEAAPHSIWVGDPKQAIYNFRGTDPQLMHECLKQLRHGEVLDTSYRSRPDLVHLVTTAFTSAFAKQGLVMADLKAHRTEVPGLPPALGLWALSTQNKAQDWQAVARGVQRLLERPEDTMVEDPVTKTLRPLQAGDIAVLCRLRESCRGLADALSAAGLEVALKQPGVMDTPEGLLVAAGLRLMLDPSDTLAAGTVAFFDRPVGTHADTWLEARLRELSNGASHGTAFGNHPRVAAVRQAAARLLNASPREALDAALEALDLQRWCLALPQASQGLANVEALRGLAAQYEERCRVLRRPATAAGLLTELDRLNQGGQDEGAEGTGGGAVRVLTYHGAKGLEWPVVVLAELDYEGPAAWSGVQVESQGAFSLANPLANRFVRFWFSPFDLQEKVTYLERLAASETAQALERRAAEERLRLLYVGATRARDHLVVAVRVSKHGGYQQSWLELLPDLVLPEVKADGDCAVAGCRTRAWALTHDPGAPTPRVEPRWFLKPDGPPVVRLPARVTPSALEGPAGDGAHRFTVGEIVSLGDPILTTHIEARNALGTAVHAFLAADPGLGEPAADREALASRILAAWGQSAVLQSGQLLEITDRLQRFLATRYPGAKQHREWPLAAWRDGQELWGQADLVLETEDGWVVIDYKTFHGTPDQTAERFGAQLGAYAKAIQTATTRLCTVYFYLAFSSMICRLTRTPEEHR
jgi:ATP-dependent exoDNAse (exonuclease V) beta subunit